MNTENVRYSCWNGCDFEDVMEYRGLGSIRDIKRHDPREYYDEAKPYKERDRRYYAAKYLIIFQDEVRRLRKTGKDYLTDYYSHVANRAMCYSIKFENTFED